MRKEIKQLLVTGMMALLLAGCGGGAASSSTDTSVAAETEQAVSNDVIGDHLVAAKDGVVTMPGVTFTLPEDLVADGVGIAGWERINFETVYGRIWLSNPDEDLISQVSHPGIFEFMGIPADKSLDDFMADQHTDPNGPSPDVIKQIYVDLGSNGTFHYFALDMSKAEELLPGASDQQRQQWLDSDVDEGRMNRALELIGRFDEYLGCFEATELKLPKMQKASDIDTAKLANLTLQDLDGKPVKLAHAFAKNKLTMIDIWKTDCTVCVEGMPSVEELSKEYADQGFGVLSVCVDVVDNDGSIDDDILYDAQDIVKTAGTTYPTVLAGKEFRDLIDVVSTPTILYVDSQGNIVDGPTRGSYPKDMTAQIIEGNLAKVQ